MKYMNFNRNILHSDLNGFYASVEIMLNPQLRGKPVSVCGSTRDRHGIVLASSAEAKRYGIKTGMVNFEAQALCTNLIMVPPQYDMYIKYSKLAREIYLRHTDIVEPYGMDECWLDVGPFDGEEVAQEIRLTMKEELGLSVSIGVSFNKIFAKLGSDYKKPDAVTVISPQNYKQIVHPLPAKDLFYVGSATHRRLASCGIFTIGDIANAPPEILQAKFGINGIKLWRYANGLDDTPVLTKDMIPDVKTVGHGITCNADLYNDEEVCKVILALCQDVAVRLRFYGMTATGVALTVKDNNLQSRTVDRATSRPIRNAVDISNSARAIYFKFFKGNVPIRSVTVRATRLIVGDTPMQGTLIDSLEKQHKTDRLELAVQLLRRRFGNDAVYSASLMGNVKMPVHESFDLIMPGSFELDMRM